MAKLESLSFDSGMKAVKNRNAKPINAAEKLLRAILNSHLFTIANIECFSCR